MTKKYYPLAEITDRQWILLDRYAVGTLAAIDQEELAHASTENPALQDLVELIPQVGGEYAGTWDATEGWNALSIRMAARRSRPSARLVSPDDPAPVSQSVFPDIERPTTSELEHIVPREHGHVTPRRHQSPPMFSGWGIAALLVVLVVSIGVTWTLGTNRRQSDVERAAAVPMREIITHAGQRATMRLVDGTVVTLAPQTHLSIPSDFGHASREVYVRGEVLFDVRQQTAQPFVVHAQRAVTHVLGTQFDVRAYDDAPTVEVAVMSGKVSLGVERSLSPAVIVPAGFVGKVNAKGEAKVEPSDMHDYTAWADGRLIFHDTPLPDVLTTISRFYNVRFTWDGIAAERRTLTADWDNRSLTHILQALSIALHARYERQDDHIVLAPR